MIAFYIKIYVSNIYEILRRIYKVMDFEMKCEPTESNTIYCGKFSVSRL